MDVFTEQLFRQVELPALPAAPFGEDHVTGSRLMDRTTSTLLDRINEYETAIHSWLLCYSVTLLRISMGMVYLGFGILKYFPGVSPAENLSLAATHLLTFGLVPAVVPYGAASVLIATLECGIGLLLITGRRLRAAIYLLAGHLIGILSPVVLLAGRMFSGPHHAPTLEGQYVLKDLILLTAAMVIATTVLGRKTGN